MAEKLGIDIGGVLKALSHGSGETFFQEPPMPGAFEVLEELSASRFKNNIWVISKCKPYTQARSLEWLSNNDFYTQTGIGRNHVLFTEQYIGKAALSSKIGITHFIDDRIQVLRHLDKVVPNLYLFSEEMDRVSNPIEELGSLVTIVSNWEDIRHVLSLQQPASKGYQQG